MLDIKDIRIDNRSSVFSNGRMFHEKSVFVLVSYLEELDCEMEVVNVWCILLGVPT